MPVFTQDDVMRKCWDEPESRDCVTCRAHYRKPGGICCFGIRYEDQDETCQRCPHIEDCARRTHAQYASQAPSRLPISTRIPIKKKDEGVIEEERLTAQDAMPAVIEDKKLTLDHFIKRAAHGAIEGSMELALGTLRFRRPPP